MSEPAWVPFGALEPAAVPLVTALPGSPADGQRVILTDSLTAGTYHWHLQYVAARATNKWIFIGGEGAIATVATSQATGSAGSYIDLATVGPQLTTPVAGLYVAEMCVRAAPTGDYQAADVGLKIGAGAVAADSLHQHPTNSGNSPETSHHMMPPAQYAASTVLKMQYNSSVTGWLFSDRKLRLTPVALGG